MRRSQEETQETIRKIMSVARAHFAEQGYAVTALEDIVEQASLTRGALYHHFKSKKGLFRAVLEEVQQEIGQRVEMEAAQSQDEWEQLMLGCRAFITAAVEPQNKRILLIDGPAVLGWEVWRQLDQQNSMRHLQEQLELMEQQGCLKPVSIEALAHALSGALNEAVLWMGQGSDEEKLEETMNVIALMLEGFKRTN